MPNVIQKKKGDDVVYVHINKKTKKGKYVILPDAGSVTQLVHRLVHRQLWSARSR